MKKIFSYQFLAFVFVVVFFLALFLSTLIIFMLALPSTYVHWVTYDPPVVLIT